MDSIFEGTYFWLKRYNGKNFETCSLAHPVRSYRADSDTDFTPIDEGWYIAYCGKREMTANSPNTFELKTGTLEEAISDGAKICRKCVKLKKKNKFRKERRE